MTDLTQVLRWNTTFMRGLAESVLSRAKNIRSSLDSYLETTPPTKLAAKPKKSTGQGSTKRPAKSTGKTSATRATGARTKKRTAKRAPVTKQ